ncbi:MAG: restriction endonuclease subunit S [Proteobacteria bacterium]|nr:restriction endonuclease subunit S [Pseudomonadota bacterium]
MPLETCVQPKSITYGVVQPGAAVEDGVPIIRVNNFLETRLKLSELMKISPEVEAKYERTRLAGGEVLLTLVGSVGQVAVAPKEAKGFNVARAVGVIHPLPDVSAEWIAICLRSPLSQYLLGSRANTTVQTTINLKEVRALPIPMPPLEERECISSLIMALDNRITLLRETNATLEAIAQALFKSWFVDFDPVRAKQQGLAPEGMDEGMAALFPDEFEESELGLMPKGWRIGALSEVCSIASGKRPPERNDLPTYQCLIPLYGGAGLMGYTSAALFDEPRILTGRVGTLGKVHIAYPPFWASDNVLVISPLRAETFAFVLHWMRTIDVHTLNRGSTQPLLTQRDLGAQLGVIPPSEVISEFESVVSCFYAQMKGQESQAQTLSTLRDTLLPRLISGQLRLPEAQAELEGALP